MQNEAKPQDKTEQVAGSARDQEEKVGTVTPIRPDVEVPITQATQPAEPEKRKASRKGKTYEVNVGNIGKPGKSKGKPKRLSVKAWTMMKNTAAATDRNQRRQLERLATAMQTKVARMISDGDANTVKEAVDLITRGAPTDDWSRAYAAVMKLEPDDRLRLCRAVEADTREEEGKRAAP
jgi:hypothetical protein